jgi:ABC-type uncharacterized transport system permease subunit
MLNNIYAHIARTFLVFIVPPNTTKLPILEVISVKLMKYIVS